MRSVRASTKGQIVIPRDVRARLGIRAGTVLKLVEEKNRIVLEPDDVRDVLAAIDEVCGSAAGSGMLDQLVKERRRERAREDRQARRLR